MDPHSYTNPHPPSQPPKLGLYFDLLDEYEPGDTLYTINVLCPPKPASRLSKLFAIPKSPTSPVSPSPALLSPCSTIAKTPLYWPDVKGMKLKEIKLKAYNFPHELRCEHLDGEKTCKNAGCYVLERSGTGWKCANSRCEGHIYSGFVRRKEDGVACFGRKGERIVCIEEGM
ncbi:hypothetical protein EJ04DRAFT_548267 [Polyplosphaeria fusca]|uniref:Uncharacterized protein n=1 Tax=Polyplosphaeria fusca TaxID=682080 RepID=A0A9P4RBZ0_9PLEO|nr:hypothetical protein EJ04DRAFT_548267 [Polyplosphaeria fusca]